MRWRYRSVSELEVEALAREVGVSPILARILASRGIRTASEAASFLSPALSQLHSPYLMSGMQAAVERLTAAIELCGGATDFHVPHRIRDGYGMKQDVIERAAAAGIRLIISVDTGIRAF